MKYSFEVPKEKMVNVIIDTDAKNEADDQYAIVHALLSPRLNVLGIVAAHFGNRRSNHSMLESYHECEKILSLMKEKKIKAYQGNHKELQSKEICEVSEGVEFIIQEVKKAKEYVNIAVLGPLTNIAAALLKEPSIKDKIRVVWVGGRYHNSDNLCLEANARNDYLAVNTVMQMCSNIVQIPAETYSKLQVSIAELEYKVKPCGEIGDYLFKQLADFNSLINRPWSLGETWSMGDTSAISILINEQSGTIQRRKAFILNEILEEKEIEKEINVITTIDNRFALEDFFAKLYLSNR